MVNEPVTVTRILYATCGEYAQLQKTADVIQWVRHDIWQRYSGLKTFGRTVSEIRSEICRQKLYDAKKLGIDGTTLNESVKDIVNDIYTYRAAAKKKIARAIHVRLEWENVPVKERSREFRSRMAMVEDGTFLKDRFLHRIVRKFFRHGRGKAGNQFIVRSDKHDSQIVDGVLCISFKQVNCEHKVVTLKTNSNGNGVSLAKRNLRVILDHGRVQIHYAAQKPAGKPCGDGIAGIDKGHTETFVDSNGEHYGHGFGKVMSKYSDRLAQIGKARNKLDALAKHYEETGKQDKAQRIRENNLGRKKLDRMHDKAKANLRDLCYKSAHALADRYSCVVCEDLTRPFRFTDSKGKRYNRLMSGWAKGLLASAIDEVFMQRGGQVQLVNAAYTSQIDSQTGRLEGRRAGDRFYRVSGDELHADENAAKNILARLTDTEITRYMRAETVKAILVRRLLSEVTEPQGAPVGASEMTVQRSADYRMSNQV